MNKTNKKELVALLNKFGVGFNEKNNNIICDQGENKIIGYFGFFTIFTFDEKGNFIEMGAYE